MREVLCYGYGDRALYILNMGVTVDTVWAAVNRVWNRTHTHTYAYMYYTMSVLVGITWRTGLHDITQHPCLQIRCWFILIVTVCSYTTHNIPVECDLTLYSYLHNVKDIH